MSLRLQLLAVALLTLVLPWAGCRYVEEMEGALRGGLEQSLLASASTMARALEAGGMLAGSGAPPEASPADAVYAHPLAAAPRIDGYRDDWSLGEPFARRLGHAHRYWVGTHGRYVYLYVGVDDPTPIYQSDPSATPYGDRLLVHLGEQPTPWLLLHTAAPGIVRALYTEAPRFAPFGPRESRVLGAWAETPGGYAVELRLPLDLIASRIGLAVIDVDPGAGGGFDVRLDASWPLESGSPGFLVHRPERLRAAAAPFEQDGRRLRVIDARGWVLFDAGELEPLADPGGTPSIAESFYRLLLGRDDPPYRGLEQPPGYLADATLRRALGGEPVTAWYARGPALSSVVAAGVPIRDEGRAGAGNGAVLLEQGSDSILTLTNSVLVRLMGFTLLASVVAGAGLLGYATMLSLRVGRLSRAARDALTPQGEIDPSLPGRGAGDEIGDLSRSFTDLLRRLREYTDYLKTLKGKLAHELRTPLAVVSTSLENLEREPHGAHLKPYLDRLRGGVERLDALILAMSEATVIERSIADTTPEHFDLRPVIESCVAAYRDIHPQRRFALEITAARTQILGSPDLIAQMLDKLIDNAVGFSEPDSTIRLSLTGRDGELDLEVANRGPRLPAQMREQLFDSLVSIRERSDTGRHLGLGLHIVALIARFHAGRVDARDLPDGSGASFRVSIPLARGD